MLHQKSPFHTHQISSITNPDRKPLTIPNPFFQLRPIQTHSFNFSNSHLKSRPTVFKLKASSSEESNDNGGGGGVAEDRRNDGGGDGDGDRDGYELPRFYFRWTDLLLGPDRGNVLVVGLPRTLGGLCARAAWEMWLIMVELSMGIQRSLEHAFVGVVLITLGVIGAAFFFALKMNG